MLGYYLFLITQGVIAGLLIDLLSILLKLKEKKC